MWEICEGTGPIARATVPTAPADPDDRFADVRDEVRQVCLLMESGVSFKAACVKVQIPHGTMWSWIQRRAKNKAAYNTARAMRARLLADEVIEIADGIDEPSDNVRHAQLQCAQRQWLASKMNPVEYGDHVEERQRSTGGDIRIERAVISIFGRQPVGGPGILHDTDFQGLTKESVAKQIEDAGTQKLSS